MEQLAYERAVKQFILNNEHLFTSVQSGPQPIVYFEKSITFGKTIADCLIFDHLNQEIGIEIKTAHDTVKRLPKQLKDYAKVCDYLWILVHNDILPEALQVLDTLSYSFVGIVTYVEYDGELFGGIYRKASYNPLNSTYMASMMMWSTELKIMAKSLANKNGDDVSKLTKKSQFIKYMIKILGEEDAKQYLVDFIVSGQGDPNKVVNAYRFTTDRRKSTWD